MIERNLGKTKSGVPGRFRLCMRNLYPRAWQIFRTAISGAVFRERTRDIRYERRVGVSRSILYSAASARLDGAATREAMSDRSAFAIVGDTLLPIMRKLCHTVGWNKNLSGNPWSRAAS